MEEKEFILIEKNLIYDVKEKFWIVEYFWIRDFFDFLDNRKVVFGMLILIEKRFFKNKKYVDNLLRIDIGYNR